MISSRRTVALGALALALATSLCVLLFGLRNANATLNNSFCHLGSAAGQCKEPEALAVDLETNRVYVADNANNRIDVFKTSGEFLFAFGWGVDTGAAKLETCTTASSCQAGIGGFAGGQLKPPSFIAVDNSAGPSKGDIYVGEEANRRVQKFDPSGNFLLAFGGGVISAGASGTGDMTSGSTTLTSLKATNKEFVIGQTITGAGIPAGTTITAVTSGPSATLTLSKAAEATASGVALTVAEGAGNKPINEKQSVELKGGPTGGTFTLTAPSRQGFSSATTAAIAFSATATEVKERLEALADIGAANVEVSGPPGGPWTVEFKGALADTNLGGMAGNASGLTPAGGKSVEVTTSQDGTATAEVCTIAANCQRGVTGSALGLFNSIRGVGVTGAGTVYVMDDRDLGQCEGIPVNDQEYERRLEKFKDTGEPIEALKVTEGPKCGQVGAFTADSAGNFYTFIGRGLPAIRKYSPAATLLKEVGSGFETRALAVNAGDDLYAAQREFKTQESGSYIVIGRYDDASGEQLRRFGYGEIESSSRGLALSAAGHVFESNGFGATPRVLDLTEPSAGPIVPPPSLKATPGATLATIKAEINPEGKATDFHFQYVEFVNQESFEKEGGFSSPKTKETAPKSVGATDFKLHGVEELIGCTNPGVEGPEEKCLVPETVYRFRILASSAGGEGNTPLEGTFETKAAPELLDLWSSEVGPDSATLGAELNPFLIPTSGFFEYVTEAQFQASGFSEASKAPTAGGIDFGEGEAPVQREFTVFPLTPGTTYHYRFHATSVLNEVIGEEATFRTLATPQIEACENDSVRYSLGALLPDCRGYEMVSPLEKGGSDIIPGVEGLHGGQAALDVSSTSGSKLAYGTLRAFGNSEGAPYLSQYIASRDSIKGWASHSLEAPMTTLILTTTSNALLDTEFRAFSADLCEAWLMRISEPLLDPNGAPGYVNLDRRTDGECEESGEASYEAITRNKPPNLPPEGSGQLELQGLSEDGTAAIYDWNDNLEGASPAPGAQPAKCVSEGEECQPRLYEQVRGGALEFVCMLPNGEPTPTPCQAGSPNIGGVSRDASVQNAISDDGERVFWSAAGAVTGPIYVRIGGTETVAVSKAAEEEAGTNKSQFWAADEDGSKVILTTGSRLYEFAVDTKTTTLVAKGVAGVVGVSEDAMKTYFISTEAIAGSGENSEGDKAVASKPNLYLRDAALGGGIRFIATVASNDVIPIPGKASNPLLVAVRPWQRAHRVSADGMSLAFTSAGTPTGYDNTDASSEEADTEVYLYDAGEDKLLCASCNPSGGRPEGEFDEYARRTQWVGAKIPTWTNILYAPRVLSEDGKRLFFESPDSLVARDTNGLGDIYEWEAPGTGTCSESSYSFSEQNQGCLDLISSGKGALKAEFVDASPTGEDVFFSYQQSLVGQDSDDLVDIYDARVNGGFPPPPPKDKECEAEACQHPAEAPLFQSPSSRQYEGPEDEEEKPKPKHCRKGTHKVKTKAGKTRCVKKEPKHHKRGRAGR